MIPVTMVTRLDNIVPVEIGVEETFDNRQETSKTYLITKSSCLTFDLGRHQSSDKFKCQKSLAATFCSWRLTPLSCHFLCVSCFRFVHRIRHHFHFRLSFLCETESHREDSVTASAKFRVSRLTQPDPGCRRTKLSKQTHGNETRTRHRTHGVT